MLFVRLILESNVYWSNVDSEGRNDSHCSRDLCSIFFRPEVVLLLGSRNFTLKGTGVTYIQEEKKRLTLANVTVSRLWPLHSGYLVLVDFSESAGKNVCYLCDVVCIACFRRCCCYGIAQNFIHKTRFAHRN